VKTGKGETEVHIKPGQFIFGRKQAAKELGRHPSTVRDRIDKLKSVQCIDIQTDTHYSIITIRNWDRYQGKSEIDPTPKPTSKPTTRRQPTDTQTDTDNNVFNNVLNNTVAFLPGIWNETLPNFPQVNSITPRREEAIRKIDRPIEDWITVIEKIAASDFLAGKNKTGWKATFDWLLKDDNFQRVLEGQYDPNTERHEERPIGSTFKSCPYCKAEWSGLRVDHKLKGCNSCKPLEIE
jgi:hypothetical protein